MAEKANGNYFPPADKKKVVLIKLKIRSLKRSSRKRVERDRLAFLREDLARVQREAEAGTIPTPVANKQIEGLNLEIARLERERLLTEKA